eukprot:s1060_g7.t1
MPSEQESTGAVLCVGKLAVEGLRKVCITGCPESQEAAKASLLSFVEQQQDGDDANRWDTGGGKPSIHFAPDLDLAMCFDDEWHLFQTTVPVVDFEQWSHKPWCVHHEIGSNPQEPLSYGAVLSRGPPVFKLRTADAWHNVPSHWALNPEGTQAPPDGQEHLHVHHAEQSIQRLFEAFLRQGLLEGQSLVEAVTLRSWFLHHYRQPQWVHPRFLQLEGHWSGWMRDVQEGWRDQLFPDEALEIFICSPDPPRDWHPRDEITIDILLVQGLDLDMSAGLISVLEVQNDRASVRHAVASSLPRHVSGYQLALVADQVHDCHLHDCRIWHGDQLIPFSHAPFHEMQEGDTFIIEPNRHARREVVDVGGQHAGNTAHVEEPAEMTGDESMQSVSSQEDLQALHIHGLGLPVSFGHVSWRTYFAVLRDVAQILRQPVNHIVAIHFMRVPLHGHQDGDEVVIAQHRRDIADGSDEKLVLIDVEMHSNQLVNGLPARPGVSRKVYKVLPQVARRHLLIVAQVSSYCDWMNNQCIVYIDNVVWHPSDFRLRDIEHGTYLRILLPPPHRPEWDIGLAVRVAEEAGDLFDFPEAGILATAIMDGQVDADRHHVAAHTAPGAYPRVVTCKGTAQGDDFDIPMMFAPGERLPRLQPAHDGGFQWLLQLGALFTEAAEVETVDGVAYLYLQTWFVHHDRHRLCSNPRPVRLDGASVGWIEELRYLWRDVLDHDLPFGIHVVQPTPPKQRLQSYAGHVLLEQAPHPHRAAGVVTNLFEGLHHDAMQQFAQSLPASVNVPTLVEELRLQPQCDLRRCTAAVGTQQIHPIVQTDLRTAFSLHMRIHLPTAQRPLPPQADDEPVEHILHFGDIVFVQQELHLLQHRLHSVIVDCDPQQGLDLQNTTVSGEGTAFSFNPSAPAFVPAVGDINLEDDFVQDLHAVWQQFAFTWEDESPSCDFQTWLADHEAPFRHCTRPRRVRLSEDFRQWHQEIRLVWHDELIAGASLEFHLVQPTPPVLEPNVVGHIILIQRPREGWVTSLVTWHVQTPANPRNDLLWMATTTDEHISLEEIVDAFGYTRDCLSATATLHCRGWFRDEILRGARARLTHGPVTHTHGPRDPPSVLCLEDLLQPSQTPSEPITSQSEAPAFLIGLGDFAGRLPQFITVPQPVTEAQIHAELMAFGWSAQIAFFDTQHVALCYNDDWCPPTGHVLLLFIDDNTDLAVHNAVIPHLAREDDMSELKYMSVLYQFGIEKAVITKQRRLLPFFAEIGFTQVHEGLVAEKDPHRLQRPWPDRLPCRAAQAMFDFSGCGELPACHLHLGLSASEVKSFFNASTYDLCTITDGLSLPDVTLSAISELVPLDSFDRLVIYTDGSSQTRHRHIAPARNEEIDVPDAWCFVVLGEKYKPEGSDLTLIGWHAHQVRHEVDHPWHIGATRIGSLIAEREALTWAMIWRIGINSRIPTVFRSDSLLSLGQAAGQVGTAVCDLSFQVLRGCGQLLQTSLGPDFVLDHVLGHLGDPWNEMTDVLAKAEARNSFYLPRPSLDMPKLAPRIPYLWMLFGHADGIPRFCGGGFDIGPPDLPASEAPGPSTSPAAPAQVAIHFQMSIATANVLSLGRTENGFVGKLSYLSTQMQALCLTFLGLQETRTSEGMSCSHGVLRLCSGADSGHWGVELWVNLHQPFAYCGHRPVSFKKGDFHVTWRDARRLLVKVQTDLFTCWLFVGHAPQSGRAYSERRAWWESTQQIIQECVREHEPLFCCMDANAAPGPADAEVVFKSGFRTSSSSDLLRDFASLFALCLPSTSDIHVGTTTTWTSPDDDEYIIDYVMIPQSWRSACVLSRVIDDMDLGNTSLDHNATGIELRWSALQFRHPPASVRGRPPCDRSLISPALTEPLQQLVVPSWTADVEEHATRVTEHVHQVLQTHCKGQRGAPRKPYLPPALWDLRREKLQLRDQLRTSRQLLRREALARIFQAWRGADVSISFNYGTSLRTSTLLCFVKFTIAARKLKLELSDHKKQALLSVLHQIDESTPASMIQKMLRPFMGSSNLFH